MREHTGTALGVGILAFSWFTLLGALLIPLLWLALTIYVVVKAVGSAPDEASPTTIALLVVGLVTALALAFMGIASLIGRGMRERRRDRRAGRDALAEA
jgi:hypothetical protein